VFAQYRGTVLEIVANLSIHAPLLAPKGFVGQAAVKEGKVLHYCSNVARVNQLCYALQGMGQREQQQVVDEFKIGKHNILVATCIGEEGLDIGQVSILN
jgi:ATP-dependent DNA helicase MPH1